MANIVPGKKPSCGNAQSSCRTPNVSGFSTSSFFDFLDPELFCEPLGLRVLDRVRVDELFGGFVFFFSAKSYRFWTYQAHSVIFLEEKMCFFFIQLATNLW